MDTRLCDTQSLAIPDLWALFLCRFDFAVSLYCMVKIVVFVVQGGRRKVLLLIFS
jgi:hypothetical protein